MVTWSKGELIDAVRIYAREHYEEDGWDFVVECWEDRDILEAIGQAQSVRQAILHTERIVKVMDSRRKDVELS